MSYLLHGDAVFDGADQPAEVAADALGLIDVWNARGRRVAVRSRRGVEFRNRRHGDSGRTGGRFEMNALVRAVPAGDVAKLAADALVRMNARDNLIAQVELLP